MELDRNLLKRLLTFADIAGDLLDGSFADSRLVLTTETHVAIASWDGQGNVVTKVVEQNGPVDSAAPQGTPQSV
jgi:hypothetical protein